MSKNLDVIYSRIINKNKNWIYKYRQNILFKVLGNEIYHKINNILPAQLTNKPWNFDENDNISQYDLESVILNYLYTKNLIIENNTFSPDNNLMKLFEIKQKHYEIKYLTDLVTKLYEKNLKLNYLNFSFKNINKINTLYKKEIINEIYYLTKISYKISFNLNNNSIIDIWKLNVLPYLFNLIYH